MSSYYLLKDVCSTESASMRLLICADELRRQHEQTQLQLQGANMQLRSAITEGMWDD